MADDRRGGGPGRLEDADAPAAALHRLLERSFQRGLARSPMTKTRLGIRDEDYGRWDDLSEATQDAAFCDARDDLDALTQIPCDRLTPADRLNYDLFKYAKELELRIFEFRDHTYPVNQLEGWHIDTPEFLITQHYVESADHAEAYIDRLKGMRGLLAQVVEGLERRRTKGILAPKFAYAMAIGDCRALFVGAPFTAGYHDSPVFEDFKRKTAGLEPATRADLRERAASALLTDVLPAYQDLIGCLLRLEAAATRSDGIWSLPDGDACYAARLLQHLTDARWTPQRIHDLGLSEVERIHGEMEVLARRLGHAGSLTDFFKKVNAAIDPDDPLHATLYYPDDAAGRSAYLRDVRTALAGMKATMTGFFSALPKSELEVRRVPPFREAAAPWGAYEDPPADGSGPGIYYLNLTSMADVPRYELEVLAYHEALPGHHLQGSLLIESTDIPGFRKTTSYNVVTEGWGLYAERIAKEMGFYRDQYSDFGRLSFELWRAARLVVDTGVHALGWTREHAIEYLLSTTPKSRQACKSAIERYMVDPGQATSYTIGMLDILRLREDARAELGGKFDVKAFHSAVLGCGSVPSAILARAVEDWIAGALRP